MLIGSSITEALRRVRQYLRKLGVPDDDAEDIAQDVLIAYAEMSKRQKIDNPIAYILASARNAASNYRKAKRRTVRDEVAIDRASTETTPFVTGKPRRPTAISERSIATRALRLRWNVDVANTETNRRIASKFLSGWSSVESLSREFGLPTIEIERVIEAARSSQETDARDVNPKCCGDE